MPIDKYSFFPITDEAQSKISELRHAFSVVDEEVQRWCPEGRLRSIALTELETAAMYAIKSVAHAEESRK